MPKKEEKKDELVGRIEALEVAVRELKDKPVEAVVSAPEATPSQLTKAEKFPIPFEYQEMSKTILNGKFGIELDYSSDTASFALSVIVPQEYSNAGKPHWEMYHEDRRTRMIQNALGANGVREWLQKVYESFDMETRSRIANDRALLV